LNWEDHLECKVEESFSQLTVSKRQGPKSKVRGSVGDGSEYELDGFNHLMDEGLSEGVSMRFGTHALELLFKRFHLLLSLKHHIVGELFAGVFLITVSLDSVSTGTEKVLVGIIVLVKIRELNDSGLIIIISTCSSEAAWFDAKHDWHKDSNNNDESNGDLVHLFVAISNELG